MDNVPPLIVQVPLPFVARPDTQPEATVTAQAVHLMGRKVAFELLTLCDNMLPARAYELGLVNRVVPDDKLLDEAMALAERLAGWNKHQLWQTKRVFQHSLSMDMDQALELARDVSVMMGRFPG